MVQENQSRQQSTGSAENEQSLIEQAQRDPEAFACLYERYVDRIHAFVYRRSEDEMLAQDITAIAFEKALRALSRYQPRGISFCAWLYVIARNELTTHQRRQRRFTFLRPSQPSSLKVDWLIERNEEVATLNEAFSWLSAMDQEILTLRFFEELANEEIAAIVGCTVSNVYVRLHRALKRLGTHFATVEGLRQTAEEDSAQIEELLRSAPRG